MAVDVVRLWQLPDDFFSLTTAAQFAALRAVTAPATALSAPRAPCRLSFRDDALAVAYFLTTLLLPFALASLAIAALVYSWAAFLAVVVLAAVLAFHPIAWWTLHWRSSALAFALARYISLEVLVDRSDPFVARCFTERVDERAWIDQLLPTVYLACPHGVFNYGAVVWCCFSRWGCGWYQYTGAVGLVRSVPGLRYLHPLIWLIDASRKEITRRLRERPADVAEARGAARRGGVVGMVPDGIAGAFASAPGRDELIVGKKRGLMRICLEEGACVYASWFFGTTDLLTVVQDPLGVMEFLSRRARAGVMYFYGRWGIPVPRRVAITVLVAATATTKTAAPSQEAVDALHEEVYGNLKRAFDAQKAFAGYPTRELVVR